MYWIEVLLVDGSTIKKESNELNEVYLSWSNHLAAKTKRSGPSSKKITTGNDSKTTGQWVLSAEKRWIHTIFY
jgi:hypothetical protein